MARLQAHAWPGNVRELRNAVQRAWVMTPGETIETQWLPEASGTADAVAETKEATASPRNALHMGRATDTETSMVSIPIGLPLAQAERELILATYEHCGRHKERTAAMLGISMKTLYNRLKAYRELDASSEEEAFA